MPYDNHFRPDEDLNPDPDVVDETYDRDRGVYASTATASALEGTYNFTTIEAGRVAAAGNIDIRSAILDAPNPGRTNVVNIGGAADILGTGDVDTDTNGQVNLALRETDGNLRVGEIRSRFADVTLSTPKAIVDADGDPEADVIAINITLTAGAGGIGSSADPLEIDSSASAPGS